MNRRTNLILLTALLVATSLSATTYLPMTDQALTEQSQAVAAVRVLSVERTPGVSKPATDYLVEVERLVAGYLPGTTLVVRVLGGTLPDGTGLHIWGAPRFKAQDRALLFLNAHEDGAFRIAQFMLGAFRQVRAGNRVFAVRDLRAARAIDGSESGLEVRSWSRFVDWVADRGRGVQRHRDYELEPSAEELQSIEAQFTLFEHQGMNIRWFDFDSGRSVGWRSHSGGQPGVPGGGHSQVQAAIGAWNADAGSNVIYRYLGTTSALGGFERPDGVNTVLFDDPNGEISDTFNCFTGGTLAIGGPWFGQTRAYQGITYWVTGEGDIITNDGLACFFEDSSNATQAAAELFGHELGHTLGLGHSCGDDGLPHCSGALNDALMRPFIHDDGRGASIRSDDKAAIATLYPVNADPAPSPPSMLTASLNGLSADLTWQDNSNDEDGFKIYRQIDEEQRFTIATVGANVTSYSDDTLETGHVYNYWVTAFRLNRESQLSNKVTVATDCDPPTSPADLEAYPTSASALHIAWNDIAEDETGYQVELMTGASGSYEVVATLDAGSTSTDLGSLASDTEFNVRVATMGDASCLSSYAEARTWTPVDDSSPPSAPDQILSILGDGYVTLTWRDNSDNELDFLVEGREANSGASYGVVANLPIDNSTDTPSVDLTGQIPGREYEYRVVARGVGGDSAYSAASSTYVPSAGEACIETAGTACLDNERFQVSVQWRNEIRGIGTAIGVKSLGAKSTAFSFFNLNNTEIIVKVLDGTGLNGNFWVFYGALSDVEYWLTVIDTDTGNIATYHNKPGDICGNADVDALPGASSSVNGDSSLRFQSLGSIALDSPMRALETGTCVADANTLCLFDSRFQVEVDWEKPSGETGVGTAIPDNDTTGFFWFFNANNTELAVKVLDGTGVNGKFWVFYGALSDVHYELKVTDTVAGTSKTYVNQQDNFCGVGDTDAF